MSLNKTTIIKTIFECYFKLPKIISNLDNNIVRKSCINYNLYEFENAFNSIYCLIEKKSKIIEFAELAETLLIDLDEYSIRLIHKYFDQKLPAKEIAKQDKTSWRTILRRIESVCNKCYKKLLNANYDVENIEKTIKSEMWLNSIYNDQLEVVYGKVDSLEEGS